MSPVLIELLIALGSAFVGWLARHYGIWMPPPSPPTFPPSSSSSSSAGG